MQLTRITDVDEIRQYISQLYTELFDEQAVPSKAELDNIFSQQKNSSNYHQAYCLKHNKQTVAFFTLGESFSIFAHGRYGIINELWVDKSFRSKGVGKQVNQEITKIGLAKGWKRIDVSAPSDEKWQRTFDFYTNNGFVFTGRKLKIYLS